LKYEADFKDTEQRCGHRPSNRLDFKKYRNYSMFMKLSNIARYFKALSSEQRLKVFLMILNAEKEEDECCQGVLRAFSRACELLKLSRSTVSHHLKELEASGLLSCERQGQSVCCQVNEKALVELREFIAKA
jgi:ArsR family transcriptional regulator